MADPVEKFLRYVKVDTQSAEGVDSIPSTAGQFELANMLADELRAMGAEDVAVSGHCYVTATVPASAGLDNAPTLGLIAHVDTSDAVSGANVHPVITKNYDGGDIVQSGGEILSSKDYPELKNYIGEDIICSDGTTLLGADDKAGVAEIMALAEELLGKNAPEHCRIRICFTPDEETGRGVDEFDIASFGADFAYTMDGDAVDTINCENFNAAAAAVDVNGVSIHPGSAKGKMINASRVAIEFDAMLPRFEDPACTEGREGFYHLCGMIGGCEHAHLDYIVRDHDMALFERKKALMRSAADYINKKYGEGTLDLTLTDSYFNMREKIDDIYVEYAKRALRATGIEPKIEPIRGGTDGARLSWMGLPCPNLGTGGHNFHGRKEFISAQSMQKAVKVLHALVAIVSAKQG